MGTWKCLPGTALVCTILAALLVSTPTASASMLDSSTFTYEGSSGGSGLASGSFSYLGGTPTKWEPGLNSASFHGFTAPAGPMTPGGATFSMMGAGLIDASGIDTSHSGSTVAITTLGIPSYSAADYAADISAALDTWAAISGFTNLGEVVDGAVNAGASEASGGHLGDIRVAAWEIVTSTTLAHAYQPGTEALFGSGGTLGGDAHFDVNRTWLDDPSDVSGNGAYDFFTVVLHELGHSLGLGHSEVVGSVMEPIYGGARRTLHADDIAGIQALYGVPEPSAFVLVVFGLMGLVFWIYRSPARRVAGK